MTAALAAAMLVWETMMSLRIGLIGAGRIVPAHLFGYEALRSAGVDDFRITAVCSRDPDRARLLVRADKDRERAPWRYGDEVDTQPIAVSDFQTDVEPRLFSDVKTMLDSGTVDAVDITTEVSLHHSQVVTCLEAGLHVLVEKPLAITMRAGRLMVEAAHRANRQLAVAEHARYIRQARLGAWVVGRGDLGTPQMLSWPSIGTRLWSPDRWVGNAVWRHRRLIGAGGASLDIGPHVFHRVRALCGEVESISALAPILEPVRYLRDAGGEILESAEADADDAFMALATFASGAIGQLTYSFSGHGEPSIPAGPALFGSGGSLNGDRLVLDGQAPTTLDDHWAQHGSADATRVFPHGLSDPFGLLISDWMAAIRENRPSQTSGDECLRDLAASFGIVESALAKGPVTLNDVLDGRVDAYQRDLDAHYGL